MSLHAQVQRFQPSQRQERIERAGDCAHGILQKRRDARLTPLRASTSNAANDVGVSVQVLGRGVHHHVETELQRPLQVRAGEGVVGHGDEAVLPGESGDAAKSTIFSSGLEGVSTQIMRVLGRSAACKLSRVR